MVTFRNNNNNNNNRRSNFRRNTRNFKPNGDSSKFVSSFSNSDNFKRKSPGRNNHNAPKLIEKYNDLAREASSNGDKILSENYLQHADHFTRVLNEKESFRREKFDFNKVDKNIISREKQQEVPEQSSDSAIVENRNEDDENENNTKTQFEIN